MTTARSGRRPFGRLARRLGMLVAAFGVALAVFAPGSIAVPDGGPVVSTSAPTGVTQTGATLNGLVNPNTANPDLLDPPTTAAFQWDATSGAPYANTNPADPATVGPDNTDHSVTAALTGLSPNKTYYYRLCATNNFVLDPTSCTAEAQVVTAAQPAISIGSVSASEGNSGTQTLSFDVRLSSASSQTVTVNYATADDTATAGSDYDATNGTLTFDPGETSKSIGVTVHGDTAAEPDEAFKVNLSNAANATIDDGTGVGTITNDDASLAVNDVSQLEGSSGGTTAFQFTVTKTGSIGSTVTVDYATGDDTAQAGTDYDATSGTLTFASGGPATQTRTFTVSVKADSVFEPDEQFHVQLSNNSANVSIQDGLGVGTIQNDDTQPTLSINDVSKAEGNAGRTTFDFTVTLSGASQSPVTFNYFTSDGTARSSDGDYDAIPNGGPITFNPGETTKTVTVTVTGDTTYEEAETFKVTLTNPTNAGLSKPSGTGTIQNDDPAPTLSINDVTHGEGNIGTTDYTFTVSLSAASGLATTVHYQTSDVTAKAGSDYTGITDHTLTFAPGTVAQAVTVQVNGDALNEADETFNLVLSAPSNATLGSDSTGVGTILNDDPLPSVSIADNSTTEGNSGTKDLNFTMTLSAPSGRAVTVPYSTTAGTAVAPSDYQAVTSGSVTFNAGETSKTITIKVVGDTIDEDNETFTVNLGAPTNATVADGAATATITNDDGAPVLSIDDVTKSEGSGGGSTTFTFNVTLSPQESGKQVSVDYVTTPGTATAGSDYTAANGSLVFAPGQTSKQVVVTVAADNLNETDESFTVELSGAVNTTIADGQGVGKIVNDDPLPTLSFSGVTSSEGNSGSAGFGFKLNLSAASGRTITLSYSTTDGTATAIDGTIPADYQAAQGTVTFGPGETSKTITVSVAGDTFNEDDETFTLGVSDAVNDVVIPTATATATITNDDVPPVIDLQDAATLEGNRGDTAMFFTVQLCLPNSSPCVPYASGKPVAVLFSTRDVNAKGAAVAGTDYRAVANAGVAFAPGETETATIVYVITNTKYNPPPQRWFQGLITNARNGSLRRGLATGTIIDDDPPPSSVSPTATTGGVLSLEQTRAVVAGSANPQGQATTVFVQYGTTFDYGRQSSNQTIAAGNFDQALSFSLPGLGKGLLYHYRLVARHNDGGTGYGNDAVFTTPSVAPPPPPPPPPAPPPPPPDDCSGPDSDCLKKQEQPVPMNVQLLSRRLIVKRGVLVLRLRCTGNMALSCRGSTQMDWNGIPAGRPKFKIFPKETKAVPVLLSKQVRKLLAKKKKLRLDVAITYYVDSNGKKTTRLTWVTAKLPAPAHARRR